MVSGVPGPGGGDPSQSGEAPKQVETGMSKMYTGAKAPGFKKWLQAWFGGNVTPEMVTAFEQNMMQMIQNSMNQSKAQHKKVEQKIKQRIDEGG